MNIKHGDKLYKEEKTIKQMRRWIPLHAGAITSIQLKSSAFIFMKGKEIILKIDEKNKS